MKRKPVTVTLADLRACRKHVTKLASRRGGVVVTDSEGTSRFRLVIPSTTLDEPRRRKVKR